MTVLIYLKFDVDKDIIKVGEFGDRIQGWTVGSLFDCYYEVSGGGTTSFPGLLHFTLDPYL